MIGKDIKRMIYLPEYLDKRLKELSYFLKKPDNLFITEALEWYLYSFEIEELLQEMQDDE